jgi:hypothetical protein
MNNDDFEEPIESLDDTPVSSEQSHDYTDMIGSEAGLKSNITDTSVAFGKHEDIGILPPNKDNDGKGSLGKKILFTIVVLLAMGFVGFGVYYYLSMANSRAKDKVKTKDLTYDVGVDLSMDPKDYATFKGVSPTNCYVDLANVDVNKAGKYEYQVVCGNEAYKGNITIKSNSDEKEEPSTIEPSAYLICTSGVEFNDDNVSAIYIVDSLGLDEDGKYLNVATREYHIMYFDGNKYKEDKASASDKKFKEYEGTVTFEDSKNEVKVVSSLKDDNIAKDSESITKQYTEKGYTCVKK